MGGDLSSEQPQAAKLRPTRLTRPGLGMKPKTTNSSAGNLLGLVRNSSFFDGIIDAGRPGLELEKQLSFDNLVKDLDSRTSSTRANPAICDEELLRLKWIEMSGFFHGEGRGNVEEPGQWLRRGNVEDWLAHYFFRGSVPADLGPSERDELRKMTTRVLEHLGLPDLPEGHNSKVKTHRLMSDPLPYLHRPLFMYALNVMVLPLLTSQVMPRLGFVHERVGGLCYWHRKPQSCNWDIAAGKKLPLILVHGLGVGLVSYYFFIGWLSQNYSYDIYVPELPFLASRPYENIPSAREVVAQLQSMLTIDGHRSGYFVGHSYGCVVVGWMQKFSSCVQCLTLMEPALFLIMHSDTILGRILYGQPKTCLELFYRYFVFRELFTVNLLCRNFFWEQSTLYPEEVSVPMLIQLASDDAVIASRSVRRIAEHERARRKRDAKRSQGKQRTTGSSFDLRQDLLQCSSASPVVPLEVHWSEGFFHGMILGHKPEATKLFHKMRTLLSHVDAHGSEAKSPASGMPA